MSPAGREWLEQSLATLAARTRASTDLTQKMVLRSRRLLDTSKGLLRFEVPKTWHPKPPQE
jgi:hypothetical protein